jgi:hypothetical protein
MIALPAVPVVSNAVSGTPSATGGSSAVQGMPSGPLAGSLVSTAHVPLSWIVPMRVLAKIRAEPAAARPPPRRHVDERSPPSVVSS